MLDTPRLDEDSDLKHVLEHSNYWFTALFTLELIIKCLAFDLLVQPDGYLLSSWNLLDLCIMVVSVISLCPEYDRLAVLRLLRVLRPLRLLSRVEGTGNCMLIACGLHADCMLIAFGLHAECILSARDFSLIACVWHCLLYTSDAADE